MCGTDPGASRSHTLSAGALAGGTYCALLAPSPLCGSALYSDQGYEPQASRVSPVADQQGAGPLLVGDPDPGPRATPWSASHSGECGAAASQCGRVERRDAHAAPRPYLRHCV